jgi:DNA-binding IclR family transcriptional regulator
MNEKGQLSSTLLKGLEILELLADQNELGALDVSRLTGYSRGSCHRLLATLEAAGYIYKTETRRYRAGLKILMLAGNITREIPIKNAAQPYLQTLAAKFRENVNLGYWDGKRVIHLDKIEGGGMLALDSRIGSEAYGHCTALGKVFLAHIAPKKLETFLDSYHLSAHTANTITSRMELLEELKLVRKQGFAIDNEELSLGLRCVAAPVFDYSGQIAAAISLSAAAVRLNDEIQAKILSALITTCRDLSRDLGFEGEKGGCLDTG